MTITTVQYSISEVTKMMNNYARLKADLQTKTYDEGIIALQKAQFVKSEDKVDMQQIQAIENAIATVTKKKEELAQLKSNIDAGIDQITPQLKAKTVDPIDGIYFAHALLSFLNAI
jgi:predicted enzyme involved in methoxymalonyl-ACP biosynthesis